jgi:hypothetical protein
LVVKNIPTKNYLYVSNHSCDFQDEVFPANPTTPPYAMIVPGGIVDRTKMKIFVKDYLNNATLNAEYQEKLA